MASATLDQVERPTPGARRRRLGPAVIILAVAVVLAACAGAEQAATPSPSQPTSPPKATPTLRPTQTAQPTATVEPSVEPPPTPSETPLESAAPAAACTGTDGNRAFYVAVASHVAWDVYCPVLPKGWIVDAGSYRTTSGGWLKIAYKASGGRRFELSEGAFCANAYGCAPAGSEAASGPFGDREATVIAADDGSFAMVVDAGRKISWMAIGRRINEATFRAFAEALILVAG